MSSLNKLKITYVILAFFFCLSNLIFASENLLLDHIHFNNSNGLSHREALCVFEDSHGHIWVTCKLGLHKYDTDVFIPVQPKNRDLIIENVSRIGEDDAGFLWLWNHNTIYFYNKLDDKFLTLKERFPEGLPFDVSLKKEGSWKVHKTSKIEKTPNGNLIIESPDQNGIYKFNAKDNFSFIPIKGHEVINVLSVNKENLIFIATDKSILKMDENGNILKEIFVNNLEFSESYNSDKGLFFETKLQPYHLDIYDNIKEINFEKGSKFIYDHVYNRFIYLLDKHIVIYDDNGNELLKIPNLEANKDLFEYWNSFLVDRYGCIWIGTDYGVSKIHLRQNLFKQYFSFAGDNKTINNSARNIVIKGTTLFANLEMGGLVKVNLNSNNHQLFDLVYDHSDFVYTLNPNKKKNDYWGRALLNGNKNDLWVGMRRLLLQVDTSGNVLGEYNLYEQTKQEDIWSLYADKEFLWIGTGSGISFLNLKTGVIQKCQASGAFQLIEETVILDFIPDGKNLWVCTENGLFLFDKVSKKITSSNFTTETDFSLKVNHLLKDKFSKNTFWLSTNRGLLKWDRAHDTYKVFDEKNGFVNENIYCAFQDASKFIWLSTDLGIVRLNQQTEEIVTYTERNGISFDEFNRTSHKQMADGRIYFGGMNGITSFHPADFLKVSSESKSFSFKVLNCIVEHDDASSQTIFSTENNFKYGIFLTKNDAKLTFSLKSDFDQFGDIIQYGYRIKGSNEDWLYSKGKNIVLTEFPNSNFTLEIKGRKIDENWRKVNLEIPVFFKNKLNLGTKGLWFPLALGLISMPLVFIFLKKNSLKGKKEVNVVHSEISNQNSISKPVEISFPIEAEIQKEEKSNLWLKTLNKHIIENLDDNRFGIEFLASKMNMSRRNLQRKIKGATGTSPKDHVNHLRLQKAKKYIETGQFKTIKEVSLAIGIKNQSYFSELFKEKFGLTPADLQKKNS